MVVSVCTTAHIAGNAVLMFVFRLGVTGAAIATSGRRSSPRSLMLITDLRRPGQVIEVGPYAAIRPDWGSSRSS